MAGRRIVYIATLLGCMLFHFFYQEWLSWFVLIFVLALPLFSLLVSLPAMVTAKVSLQHPEKLEMGSTGSAFLQVRCRFIAPPFQGKFSVQDSMTGSLQRYRNRCTLNTDHCGGMTLLVTGCWVYDYLGLFRRKVCKNKTSRILILPRPMVPETVPDLSRAMPTRWHPKPGGGFSENHELRPYRPGDNLQQIHWKLTAKTGSAIIREAMESEQGQVILSLDLSGSREILDKKLGQLLWLSEKLLEEGISHEIYALTGNGIFNRRISDHRQLEDGFAELLWQPCANSGSIQQHPLTATWIRYIGGGTDET